MSDLPYTVYDQRRSRNLNNRQKRIIVRTTVGFCLVILVLVAVSELVDCVPKDVIERYDKPYAMHTNIVIGRDGVVHKYDRSSPLLFISGVNMSGTELLRDVLNFHPDIRCNSERHFINKLIRMKTQWYKSANESYRLKEGGVSKKVAETAIAAFTLEMMARSGKPAKVLCTEDFHSIKFAGELLEIFPQAKFILVVRDPLHFAHAKLQESNLTFNETLFKEYLTKWDVEMQNLITACSGVVSFRAKKCLILHYELLYLRPRFAVRLLLEFVLPHPEQSHPDIPDTMVPLLKPGKNEDLHGWVQYLPKRAIRSIGSHFEMVDALSYGHIGYPPNYTMLQWIG